jgi:hypothetical protein
MEERRDAFECIKKFGLFQNIKKWPKIEYKIY